MKIVSVQFLNSNYTPIGKHYTYFTEVDLSEGDLIQVPTRFGMGNARVSKVDIQADEVDCTVLEYMQTITSKESI